MSGCRGLGLMLKKRGAQGLRKCRCEVRLVSERQRMGIELKGLGVGGFIVPLQ